MDIIFNSGHRIHVSPNHKDLAISAADKLLQRCRLSRVKDINKLDQLALDKLNTAIIEGDDDVLRAIGRFDEYWTFFLDAEKFVTVYQILTMALRLHWLNSHDLNIEQFFDNTLPDRDDEF